MPLLQSVLEARVSGQPGLPVPKHEVQHRAYLQKLQERNQAHRQQRENDGKVQDQLRREQGFSVCFSGANASKGGLPSKSRQTRGSRLRGNSPWRRWEEATVEIKGLGGEVYAIRPSGERVAQQDMQAPILNFCKDALPSWASTQKEELNPLEATQDLAALHLSTEVLDEPRTEATLPGQCEADKIEEPFFQDISVPDDLVERVARLPNHWRRALLELLEEAEAMQQWEEDQDQEQLEQPELETLAETIRQDPEVELEEPEEVEEQVQSDACEAEHSSELSKQNEALETPEASGSSEPQSEREDRLDTEAGGDVPVQSGDAPDQSEQSQIQVPSVEEVKRSEDEMPPEPTNKDLVAAGGGPAAVRAVRAASNEVKDSSEKDMCGPDGLQCTYSN
ncbi:Uncharacterized protein SCF082_LOCUS43848 [Durusdinium trenchii]|uniref:Uncharacterized protein n=1 Tax=Durusdinium trenchii TaxID=1381693 RepID=A0ABP0QYZ7_9DINO